jgi:hypothetical protein
MVDAERKAEQLGARRVQAFETVGLIGTAAAPAVLSYVFHRIEDRLDGVPTMLIIDEGWLAGRSPWNGCHERVGCAEQFPHLVNRTVPAALVSNPPSNSAWRWNSGERMSASSA